MAEQGSMTGKIFGGRYQINDRVGIGGMAEVYRAQDNVLGRSVAVKVMLPQYAKDSDFTRRFRQEAAAAANLQSPYIVNVYDWGQDGDTYYIVMEFVRGSDLKTAIRQRGAINQHKVAEIGSQVCQALTVAHNQDIIHRDIKPQNIMVQPDGNVKVMDFGIARAKNSVSGKTGSVLGTAHYISPEQAQGKELTAASDIYSLGVVLYEAATGKLPFDGPDAMSVALMQVKDFPTPPREVNPNIDPALEDIIMTALEKDPANRFATANDMRLALNDYLAGRTSRLKNNFTSDQTRVIGPAAGVALAGTAAAGATQVMPGVKDANAAQTKENTTGQLSPDGDKGNNTSGSKKRSRTGIIVAIVVIIAIVAVVGAAYAFIGGGADGKISVPDVVGKSQAEATQLLEDAGLEVGTVSKKYDDTVAEGLVISQDPNASEEVEKGTKVKLVISQGVQTFAMPSIEGKTVEEAQEIADKNGLVLKQSSTENSSTVDVNHIISQDPAPGTGAKAGDTLYYVLSLGPAVVMVDVPSVVGYNESSARSTLSNAGLGVSVNYQDSDSVTKGNVISQSISAGTSVAKGTTVTITVSNGSSVTMASVPDVVGYGESSARSALLNAGLDVDVDYEYSSSTERGVVMSQSPRAGASVEEGTTVTITVSSGVDPSTVSAPDDDDDDYSGSGNSSGDSDYDYDDEDDDDDDYGYYNNGRNNGRNSGYDDDYDYDDEDSEE